MEPMTNSAELLPCPFCGCEVVRDFKAMDFGGPKQGHVIDCNRCNGGFHSTDRAQSVERWNTRAESRPSLQGNWRPIAEAPKDGRYVLIATPRHDGDMLVAMFDQNWGDDGWWLTDDGKNPEIPLRGPAPTHWMPLPSPPSEQEEG